MRTYYTLLLLLLLSSCWSESTPIETIRPVELSQVEPLELYNREFIGIFSAVESSNLALPVSGTLERFLVSEGQRVKKGDVLVRLNPSDYQLKYEAERSQYLTSKANFERSERLLERGAISVQDYQIATSNYEASRARYLYAQDELNNTALRAPYSGSVEVKYVSDYAEVVAGQSLCKLIDPNILEVDFTLPHSDFALSRLKSGYYIVVDSHPSRKFSASVSEVVDASIDGAGVPVTLTITDPEFSAKELGLISGVGCRVRIEVDSDLTKSGYTVIPLRALRSSPTNSNHRAVWRYSTQDSTVNLCEVTTSELFGEDHIIVSSGLEPNDMVVSAGIYSLEEGQRVKPL